jgi:hypothetical protein
MILAFVKAPHPRTNADARRAVNAAGKERKM